MIHSINQTWKEGKQINCSLMKNETEENESANGNV